MICTCAGCAALACKFGLWFKNAACACWLVCTPQRAAERLIPLYGMRLSFGLCKLQAERGSSHGRSSHVRHPLRPRPRRALRSIFIYSSARARRETKFRKIKESERSPERSAARRPETEGEARGERDPRPDGRARPLPRLWAPAHPRARPRRGARERHTPCPTRIVREDTVGLGDRQRAERGFSRVGGVRVRALHRRYRASYRASRSRHPRALTARAGARDTARHDPPTRARAAPYARRHEQSTHTHTIIKSRRTLPRASVVLVSRALCKRTP